MKFGWGNRCLVALLAEFDRDGRSVSVALDSDVNCMISQTFAIIYYERFIYHCNIIFIIFIMGGWDVLVCPSSFTLELFISLRPRFFYDACGRLSCDELLVFFEVEISISVGFDAGVVIVGLVEHNFTYLLSSWYLTW